LTNSQINDNVFHQVRRERTIDRTSILRSSIPAIAFLLCAGGVCANWLSAQEHSQKQADSQAASSSSTGKRTFTTMCAGCHGLDGRGGERAPSIVASSRVRRGTDAQIAGIVSNGIPGTGMPSFSSLNSSQVSGVVAYIRALQGTATTAKLPGDPEKGKAVFFGKGECATCHTIAGEGGFLGPDLSAYGSSIPVKAILDSLLTPTRIVPAGYRLATVTGNDGTQVEGIVRNEDNFTLQLQTRDGTFHFFQKTAVQKVEYSSQSLMPTNYGQELSSSELNDLASYLITASSSPKTAQPKNREPNP
jgi:cytochrome c oxidase cbb3-type subunit 3